MVTASGRPSGTATTTIVTAKMKNSRGPSPNSLQGHPLFSTIQRIINTKKHTTATKSPIFPIADASTDSFSCNGVGPDSLATSEIVLPHSLLAPTASTIALPLPSLTCDPLRSHTSPSAAPFFTGSVSPVRLDSSVCRPNVCTTAMSATILSPVSTITISPTTTSVLMTTHSTPSRSTLISITSFCALSFWNDRSFDQSFPAPTSDTTATATQMATPSTQAFCSRSAGTATPSTVDTSAAAINMMMMGSLRLTNHR
mmetsp:Transcript_12307/g.35034  ORF Transcript_12307/g.35034 Transcript_12307/m.35034 type:complete len:256 (-) Transcript_12307:513-1280(-)